MQNKPTIPAHQRAALEAQLEETTLREFEGKTVQSKKYEGTAYATIVEKKGTTKEEKTEPTFYTLAQVAQHSTRGDCWVAVDNKVYDLSKYMFSHPGGSSPICAMGGRDATDAFHNYHPAPVYKQMQHYYIGEVLSQQSEASRAFAAEHRALRQQFLAEGLYETNKWYYVMKSVWFLSLFASAIYFTVTGESFLWRMLGGAFLALFFQQMAFMGHDLGHNGVSHVRAIDSTMGVIYGPLLSGISMAWWKHTHNVHHVACNSIDIDPDIQHMPLLAVTPKMLPWFRKKFVPTAFLDSFGRFMVTHQGNLFFVIMAFARFNLYVQSLILLFTWPEKIPKRKYEIISMFTFIAWMTLLVSTIPSNWERVVYLIFSHALAGVLHIQIVLSHFAMPTYNGKAYNGDADEWFRMQVRTSLNVDCPRWMDWFHGGLQFQAEHHLWPRIPRHNLRHVQKTCIAFCKKHDIEYTNKPFLTAIGWMKEHLESVAAEVSKMPPENQPGFFDSMIWDGANARG